MMNTENIEQTNVQVDVEETLQYKRVLAVEDTEENTQPVDFRRVQQAMVLVLAVDRIANNYKELIGMGNHAE